MKYRYLLFAILLLLHSCKTSKLKGPERIIKFGSGGGITGMVSSFTITSHGKLYIEELNNSHRSKKLKLTQQSLKEIFDLADSLQKHISSFSNPGNIYSFISFSNDIDQPPLYTWGELGFAAPEPVIRLYNRLQTITIKNKNK